MSLALVTGLVGCASTSTNSDGGALSGPDLTPTGTPIVIGADLDTTGPAASYNLQTQAGIKLAVAQINRAGGVLDRPLRLAEQNSESDPAKAPTAYNGMINDKAVAAIGYVTVGIPSVKSLVQDAKMLTIAAGSTSDALVTTAPADYLYSLLPTAPSYVEAMCGAFESVGAKKIAIFHDDAPGVVGLVASYDTLFKKSCLPEGFVGKESAPLTAADFTAPVARIAAAKPDAILTVSVGGTFQAQSESAFAQALPKTPRFAIGAFDGQPDSWKTAQPGALNGLVVIHPVTSDNPRTVQLQEDLRAFSGDTNLSVSQTHALGYDSVKLIALAIEKAGTVDNPDALNTAFQEIKGYQPTFGQAAFTLSFGADKHIAADSSCGLAFAVFGKENTLTGSWADYQPTC
ncbi:ABC transporter substrate-binding protein [Arthrobacter sp. EPSL27]|uniref:ABC transporter substrate-binding protein n=1 Tax=Arthrobacter sp. EPSL27 TaxID=1745378 RepID=UPI001E340793|nr:ABC transporter substrate-binding protein [Arthrobacter sp. EPSL27]